MLSQLSRWFVEMGRNGRLHRLVWNRELRKPHMISRTHVHSVLALTLVSFVALTATSTPADAVSRKVRIACAADAKRLCPLSKPGTPELDYCMEAKGKYLSRECKRALEDDGIIPRGYFNR
jgi:hypothetical protein